MRIFSIFHNIVKRISKTDSVVEDLSDAISTLPAEVVNMVYPVGSIYMSVTNTNPSTIFGGTWEQIKDTFLLSAGDTYTAGATGGEATHVLSESEMPKHNHNWRYVNSSSSSGNGGLSFSSTGVTAWAYEGTVEDSHYQYIEFRGGNQSHNNMPPYLAVYVWKRTA